MKNSSTESDLAKAQHNLAEWWRSHKNPQPGVRGELLKHLSALRKCLERVETIDDRSAESGSTWKSTELEGDIEAAGRALTFLCDMFGVGHGDV